MPSLGDTPGEEAASRNIMEALEEEEFWQRRPDTIRANLSPSPVPSLSAVSPGKELGQVVTSQPHTELPMIVPGGLATPVLTSQPSVETGLQAPPCTPATPKTALPPYPPPHSRQVSRAQRHHSSRVRSERGRSRDRHVDNSIPRIHSPPRTDFSPPAGSVFHPPPPDSTMGIAQMEHEAHLAHVSQTFGTRPTSVQVGGHLNSKVRFRWANDDSGERIMITEAHAALTASLLLGQDEVNWVQLSSFLEAMNDITPFSGGPDDFKILWRTLGALAAKNDKISQFLDKYNPRMYNALRDRARNAENTLQEAKEGSASLVNLNAQLESRTAGLLQDLDNSQVRLSCFESLLQSTTRSHNETVTKLQADNKEASDKVKAAHRLHEEELLKQQKRADHLLNRNNALLAELAALRAAQPSSPTMDAQQDISFTEELADLQATINVLRPRYLALLDFHPNPERALALLPQDQRPALRKSSTSPHQVSPPKAPLPLPLKSLPPSRLIHDPLSLWQAGACATLQKPALLGTPKPRMQTRAPSPKRPTAGSS